MAGFWPQSFSQMNDLNGKPIVQSKAYFYSAATTTPIAVFRDYGLTTPHPNPVSTDGYGRFPAVYLDEDDEFYHVRVTTSGGSVLYDADQIPIIGPTSGGGGGGGGTPVDPNAVLRTGDIKARYGEGFLAGFVRGNGRSIGTSTSGATERANSDAQVLYEFLWNADPNLVVAGGRGGSANSDWLANKPLDLPDFRGRAIIGLDVMGNIAAGRVTDADELGWAGGSQTHTLVAGEMPSHAHEITINSGGAHTHTVPRSGTGGGAGFQTGSPDGSNGTTGSSGAHTHTATIAPTGGGAAHNNLQPSMAVTVYIRL